MVAHVEQRAPGTSSRPFVFLQRVHHTANLPPLDAGVDGWVLMVVLVDAGRRPRARPGGGREALLAADVVAQELDHGREAAPALRGQRVSVCRMPRCSTCDEGALAVGRLGGPASTHDAHHTS
jgi:hypothetical protein